MPEPVDIDRLIRRQLALLRVYDGYGKSLIGSMAEPDKQLRKALDLLLDLSEPERQAVARGVDSTQWLKRFNALMESWKLAAAVVVADGLAGMVRELIEFALADLELSRKEVGVIIAEAEAATVLGYKQAAIGESSAAKTLALSLATIRGGFSDQMSAEDVIRAVVGSRQLQYRDGVISRRNDSLMGWAHTVASHANTFGTERAWSKQGWDYVRLVSVLDSKTSAQCRVVDGEIWPVGKGHRPPFHFRCRTIAIPSSGREPPEKLTYSKWFEQQPEWFQRDTLGATRFKLYRDGKLPMTGFVHTTGRELTLDELRARESSAWSKAGLE